MFGDHPPGGQGPGDLHGGPAVRHGHKTAAHRFDGYKGYVGIDLGTEIITATTVTPGNARDASVASDLIADLIALIHPADTEQSGTEQSGTEQPQAGQPQTDRPQAGQAAEQPQAGQSGVERFVQGVRGPLLRQREVQVRPGGARDRVRVQDPVTGAAQGWTVHTVTISTYEAELVRARNRQTDLAWKTDYTATRPRVERKIGHLMRRNHGGRRARVRGLVKVIADFALLAAAINIARLGRLAATFTATAIPAVAPT